MIKAEYGITDRDINQTSLHIISSLQVLLDYSTLQTSTKLNTDYNKNTIV